MTVIAKHIILLFCASIVCFLSINAQTIPNASFESWTTSAGQLIPVDWEGSDISMSGSLFRSLDAYDGTFALGLRVVGSGSSCGQAILASGSSVNYPLFPCTGQPSNFNGYYKFNPVNGDTAQISVGLGANDTLMVAFAEKYFTESTGNSWQPFSIPLTYVDFTPIQLAVIYAAANSSANPDHDLCSYVNSSLLLDKLSFSSFQLNSGESNSVPSEPIIFGETGTINRIEDAPNDYELRCSLEVPFHNSLWATAFSGSLGAGIQWYGGESPQQRAHFVGLSNFVSNIDFNQKNYTARVFPPEFLCNLSVDNPGKITGDDENNTPVASYYLVSSDGNSAVGWVHNRTNYWGNYITTNACLQDVGFFQIGRDIFNAQGQIINGSSTDAPSAGGNGNGRDDDDPGLGFRGDDDQFTASPVDVNSSIIRIKGLSDPAGTDYLVSWHSTSTGGIMSSNIVQSTIDIDIPLGFCGSVLQLNVPAMTNSTAHDWAFQLEAISQRTSLQVDTLTESYGKDDGYANHTLSTIEGVNHINEISVWPNPSSGVVNITNPYDNNCQVIIHDALGRMHYKGTLQPLTTMQLNVEWITSGLYTVSIHCEDKTIYRKLLLQR